MPAPSEVARATASALLKIGKQALHTSYTSKAWPKFLLADAAVSTPVFAPPLTPVHDTRLRFVGVMRFERNAYLTRATATCQHMRSTRTKYCSRPHAADRPQANVLAHDTDRTRPCLSQGDGRRHAKRWPLVCGPHRSPVRAPQPEPKNLAINCGDGPAASCLTLSTVGPTEKTVGECFGSQSFSMALREVRER